MTVRRLLWWVFAVSLVTLILLGSAFLSRWQPELHASWRLAVLLAATKGLADLLEIPLRPKRPTFYYEDYVAQWLHFGILAIAAVAAHALAGEVIDRPLTTGPLALGTYLVWRLTSPPR